MARKKTQAYSEEFRKEAVRRAQKKGSTAASVAKELGVSPQQIYNWKRQFNRLSDKQFNSVDGVDYSKKESSEMRKLRKKNAELEKEIEFLKRLRRTLRTSKSEVRCYS
ncbi:transposase [Reinekea blandensis]|uniref:Transposase and inactivated derivative n=1 Tax=Reinekea blandensis MED297 TaxID=314283 RepID=A4BFM3_9GAMM|nr:transposase [Reinekea blandensis]EAR09118.1 transposase and inactivated derivative [Reinekea sp. MED297] [Reinekea blandensis MED297]